MSLAAQVKGWVSLRWKWRVSFAWKSTGCSSKHQSRHGKTGQQSRAPGHHLLPQRRWPRHWCVPLPSGHDRCWGCGFIAGDHDRAEERRQSPDRCHRERGRKPRCCGRCCHIPFEKNRCHHRHGHLERQRKDADPDAQSHPQGNASAMEHPKAGMHPEILSQPAKAAGLLERLSGWEPAPKPLLEFSHRLQSIDELRSTRQRNLLHTGCVEQASGSRRVPDDGRTSRGKSTGLLDICRRRTLRPSPG